MSLNYRCDNAGRGVWNLENLIKQGYVKGSVIRVKMVNFLTYDDGEVFPGPRLNVILGPNGSNSQLKPFIFILIVFSLVN